MQNYGRRESVSWDGSFKCFTCHLLICAANGKLRPTDTDRQHIQKKKNLEEKIESYNNKKKFQQHQYISTWMPIAPCINLLGIMNTLKIKTYTQGYLQVQALLVLAPLKALLEPKTNWPRIIQRSLGMHFLINPLSFVLPVP